MISEADFHRIKGILRGLDDKKDKVYKLKLYEAIAPDIDNFYFAYGPTTAFLGASSAIWGPLVRDIFSSFQFDLPNQYHLYLYSTTGGGTLGVTSVGKLSGLEGGTFYGTQGAYPSSDVHFHFKNLYPKVTFGGATFDYNFKGISPSYIASNERVQKLLNIVGVDFIVFHNYFLDTQDNPLAALDSLTSLGFVPFEVRETFRFKPRFPKHYHVQVLRNTNSYGKAYIARSVQTINPKENMLNGNILDLGIGWPLSKTLQKKRLDTAAKDRFSVRRFSVSSC